MSGEVTVVGAGLSGSLMAICLARRGFRVRVFERRGDPRVASAEDGRSFNLGLSARGIAALRHVDLLDEVLPRTIPMRGRVVHEADNALSFQPYGLNDEQILRSVLRGDLSRMLIERAATLPNIELTFNTSLSKLDKGDDDTRPTCSFDGPDGPVQVESDLVIGADGAYSTVRTQLNRGEPVNYRQDFLPWGYKEITIPAGPVGDQRSDPEALHVWPGGERLVVAHPNVDRSLTGTVFLPLDGPESFASLKTAEQVETLFRQRFPDLLDLVPDVVEQFVGHPVGHLVTVRTQTWHHRGRVVLIGDACHAVYPFYGQGMNSSFEDCVTLDECLAATDDRHSALRDYQQRRKPNTDVLADLSEQNFVELRDRLVSPLFLARKKADLFLNRLFPRSWIPLYTMVSHSTTPYADALRRDRRQRSVLNGLGLALAAGTAVAGYGMTKRVAGRAVRGSVR